MYINHLKNFKNLKEKKIKQMQIKSSDLIQDRFWLADITKDSITED